MRNSCCGSVASASKLKPCPTRGLLVASTHTAQAACAKLTVARAAEPLELTRHPSAHTLSPDLTPSSCRRGLLQFTPKSFEIYQWTPFSSPKRFLESVAMVSACLVVELNAFFLKSLLWLQPSHPLNICRLLLWFFVGLPAIKEYFAFLQVRSHPAPRDEACGVRYTSRAAESRH